MKTLIRTVALMLVMCTTFALFGGSVSSATVLAFPTKSEDSSLYYDEDKPANGAYKKDGETYYFRDGKMVKNQRVKDGKKLYYLGSDGKCTRMVDGNKKMVALTYDDGPSKYTKTILDTLDKYNQKATFFVVGDRVNTYKKTVKREYKMGCQIGNHTYNHKILTKCSKSKIRSQISKTDSALKKINGVGTTIMRPPGGSNNKTVRKNVGKPVIIWSLDTMDWKTRSKKKTVNTVMKNVKDGDIILMHDLYKSTADASKEIIPKLVNKGYQLVTVEEMALLRKGGMKNGKVYYSFRK